MNLLAIDACTEVCSVSLVARQTRANRLIRGVAKSSGLVLSLCAEVFAQLNFKPEQLDGIIYTQGPGAFTGVRMCVGVVQGLALAHNIPTLGFSTLEVMARAARKKYQNENIAVALDARMSEVYWGVYRQQQLQFECVQKPDQVETLGADFVGVGSGWGAYGQVLSKHSEVVEYEPDFYSQASDLMALALDVLNKTKTLGDNLPAPTYLRNNVAAKSLK